MLARGQVPLVKDHSLQVARSTQSLGPLLARQATTPETTTPKRLLGLLTTALRSAAVRTAKAVSLDRLTEDSSFGLQRCLHARSMFATKITQSCASQFSNFSPICTGVNRFTTRV